MLVMPSRYYPMTSAGRSVDGPGKNIPRFRCSGERMDWEAWTRQLGAARCREERARDRRDPEHRAGWVHGGPPKVEAWGSPLGGRIARFMGGWFPPGVEAVAVLPVDADADSDAALPGEEVAEAAGIKPGPEERTDRVVLHVWCQGDSELAGAVRVPREEWVLRRVCARNVHPLTTGRGVGRLPGAWMGSWTRKLGAARCRGERADQTVAEQHANRTSSGQGGADWLGGVLNQTARGCPVQGRPTRHASLSRMSSGGQLLDRKRLLDADAHQGVVRRAHHQAFVAAEVANSLRKVGAEARWPGGRPQRRREIRILLHP